MKNNRKIIMLMLISMLVLVLAACGGSDDSSSSSSSSTDVEEVAEEPAMPAGDATHGEELFVATCLACHGEGGIGIEGLGKDMTTSAFISGLSDAELLAFLKVGRSTSDPENTTGVDMAPKGGNPSLDDADLMDIIAYMRTLEK